MYVVKSGVWHETIIPRMSCMSYCTAALKTIDAIVYEPEQSDTIINAQHIVSYNHFGT